MSKYYELCVFINFKELSLVQNIKKSLNKKPFKQLFFFPSSWNSGTNILILNKVLLKYCLKKKFVERGKIVYYSQCCEQTFPFDVIEISKSTHFEQQILYFGSNYYKLMDTVINGQYFFLPSFCSTFLLLYRLCFIRTIRAKIKN